MTDSNQQIMSKTAGKEVEKIVERDNKKSVLEKINAAIAAQKEQLEEAVLEVVKEVMEEEAKRGVKDVVKEVANPNKIPMHSAEDAIDLIQKLYNKVNGTLQYMSSMTSRVNRYDRITNQEMHIVNKLYRFLSEALREVKENPSAGESESDTIYLYASHLLMYFI